MAAVGFAVISADYRLLAPCTGHDVLDDVVDLFAFLASTRVFGTVQVDSTRLVVAGNSAGGLCAFLAAIHADPKPRAVLSMYGLGGEMFVCSPSILCAYLCLNSAYAPPSTVCYFHMTVTACPLAQDEALLPRLRAP